MTLGDSGITHPDQLAGKTIGYPGIPSQLSMLETILDRYDIDMDDITLSNVGFDLVRVLVGGSEDAILGAYYTHESILIHQQTDLEPNIIQVEEHGVPDYYELVLITAADNLETRPEFVEKVATGVINGYEAVANAPQDSITNLLAQPRAQRSLMNNSNAKASNCSFLSGRIPPPASRSDTRPSRSGRSWPIG